ncbi:MAG: histidine kinase N-terminal 7TM domain-containing protein [Haloarculaceae archaeon]
MAWQSTPYLLLLFGAAVTTLVWAAVGANAIREGRRDAYVVSFTVLCVAVAIWAAGYAVQVASTTLPAKLLAYKLLHVGGVLVPPAWFAFALAYTGRARWLTPATVAGLLAVPLALLAALVTNPDSLALSSPSLEQHGGLVLLATGNGPLYQLHLAYSYVVILAGAALVALDGVRTPGASRRQAALLVTGAAIPIALNVCNVLAVPPLGTVGVNLTPVSLALSTVLFGVTIVRGRLLDLTPVAWDVATEQLSDGVLVLDERDRVLEANPAASRLLGTDEAGFGTPVEALLPAYPRLMDEPQLVVTHEVGGEPRQLQVTRTPLTSGGTTYGAVVLVQDVTARECHRVDVEQRNERLDEFAKTVAHDLRNPLSVIRSYAELAERTGDRQHFAAITDAVDRTDTFLEELLDLAQRGETVTELRPVAIEAVVEAAAAGVDEPRLRVDVETDAVVVADDNRLEQVFDNLLRNARDHADGDVTVTVGETDQGIYVEDDGPGVPADEREAVFDAGYTTRTEGTGFGLAIVRNVVEAHGWSITVTEGSTGGARFEIAGLEIGASGEFQSLGQ